MDSTKKIVNTDKVCRDRVEASFNKVDKINIVTEAKNISSKTKKVGPPTLVKNKKCAKEIKRAGLHPTGITSSKILLLKIIYITAAALSQTTSCPISWPQCAGLPGTATSPGWQLQQQHHFFPFHPPVQYQDSPKLSAGASWSNAGVTNNKLIKMINGNRRQGYNIGMWNCRRGLIEGEKRSSTKMTEVIHFLQSKKLHILCLVEADLHGAISRYKRLHPLTTKDINDILGVPGYKLILPKTWQIHGLARIIVIAKEELQVKVRDLGAQNGDLPTLTCEIGLAREKKTVVNFFYREFTGGVSGLKDTQAQIERLSRQIRHWKTLCAGTRDVICLGDANLCAVKWHEEKFPDRELADMTQNFLLETASTQLVKEFTRSEVVKGGEISRSCIDHCYTNVPEKVSKPELIAVGSSDHLGVVVTKFTRAPMIKPKIVEKRSYKFFNVENFLIDILNSNLNEEVTACDDLEEAASTFETKFRIVLDSHAPVKKFQMRKNYAPFVSEETKLLMQDRKVLKEEAVKTGDPILETEAKRVGKEIKKALENDKKEYFAKDFGEKVDPATAWRAANEIMGQNKNLAPTAIKQTDDKGETEIVTNPKKLADMFNTFFKRKVEKLREKTNHPPVIPPSERLQRWLTERGVDPPPFNLKEIDRKGFRGIMKKMKGKRVHGVDWIDSFSLKIASPLIEDCLIHLINLSIRTSRFSTRWKPQLIFPFHKKKDKDMLENYRPVSHLVQVGKMIEYAVYFQIVEHFTTHNLFHPNHHGSLANHSTATAIIQLFDMWLEAADNQELSAVCLLDQSAAYDLLCHQTLHDKLKLYNFDQPSIKWIMSYLSGRSQLVQVEASTSNQLDGGDHAVPQGSVLGGLLHVINSNDFPACHDVGDSIVYVDDDSDNVHAKDPEVLRDLIEQEAGNSARWLRDNRLCVAGDKSKLMVVGTRELKAARELTDMSIIVDGKAVKETSSEKLLGVVLNNDLTWKNHLHGDHENEGLIPQLSKRLGVMKLLSKFMSKEKLKYFASGIFYSKLNYCLPVFGSVFGLDRYKEESNRYRSFTKTDNNRLQVLQNKLNRLLIGARYDTPTSELLAETDSLSIQQMIAHQTAIMAYKIVQSKKPEYLAEKIQVRNVSTNLRGGKGSIGQPGYSLSTAKEGFLYRAATILNMMDEKLRSESKIESFKTLAKEWVKENIAIKPTPSQSARIFARPRHQEPPPEPAQSLNTIRRYFHPIPMPIHPDPPPKPATKQSSIVDYFHQTSTTTRRASQSAATLSNTSTDQT